MDGFDGVVWHKEFLQISEALKIFQHCQLVEIKIEDFEFRQVRDVLDCLDTVVGEVESAQSSETLKGGDFINFGGEGWWEIELFCVGWFILCEGLYDRHWVNKNQTVNYQNNLF